MNDLLINRPREGTLATIPRFFAVLLLVGLTAGCGESKFELAPVSGKVLLDGQPVSNARVVFMPRGQSKDREAGNYSQGETDVEGYFQLKTTEKNSQSGAVVGLHRVMVTTRKARIDPNDPDREIVDVKETIPSLYSNYRSTPLTFVVPKEGTDKANFDIPSSERRWDRERGQVQFGDTIGTETGPVPVFPQ